MVDGDEEEWNKQSHTISWLLANFLHVSRHMSSLDKQLPDQQSSDEPCSHLSSDDFLKMIRVLHIVSQENKNFGVYWEG